MHKPGSSRHSWANQKKKRGKFSFKKLISSITMAKTWDKKSLIKNLVLSGIALFLFGTILFLGLFAWYSRDLPNPDQLIAREIPESTKIYDRTGEHLLFEISGDERRTIVRIDELPDYIAQATITAEDRKFYEHKGIDIKGIIRALLVNISTLDPTAQGASTITQQLVKNAILTNEKTIARKVKEIILSLALERRYEKDEILQLYLNEIPYGSTNYGIESAAQAYFSKPAAELTIAESATLASLPKAPTTYLNNPDRLLERRDWILYGMEELGYISSDELTLALEEETPVNPTISGIQAPHFVMWVKELLVEEYGERMVEQGGLDVITTLDFDKQQFAEEAVTNGIEARSETYNFNNTGLVSLDPKNGQVLAMVGSADYFSEEIDGAVNITRRALQPGSSFKPIIYTAAFEAGYTPNTILWDVKTTFPTSTGPYSPNNFDFDERGPITVRSSLQGSLNIPAVKMLYLIGVQNGLNFAERLGYSTFEDRSRFGLAIVLGGGEVLPIEHAAAYGVFANEGNYYAPEAILRVEDSDGNVLEEWEEKEGEKVLETNLARMISNVLSDDGARAYIFGTGSNLTLPGRAAAAKTGTTNDNKDAWTVGYTPQIVTAVWAGNTDGTSMSSRAGGSSVAAPVWNEYMRRAHEGLGVEWFNSPTIPVTGKAILDGQIPSERIVIDKASGKLATDLTPDSMKEEKVCGEYHNILTYVDRSNPLGPAPSNPEAADSSWDDWENAVQDFITRHNAELEDGEAPLENCEIPTEEDDVHTSQNQPRVNLRAPKNNADVGRSFDVDVRANAKRGIARIEILIDDQVILISGDQSIIRVDLPSWVQAGTHTLTVAAYDDVDNVGMDSATITVNEGDFLEGFTITNPTNGQIIEVSGNTYTIVAESSNAADIRTVGVTATNLLSPSPIIVAELTNPGPIISIPWQLPGPGSYVLNVWSRMSNGDIAQGVPVRILIKNPAAIPEDLLLVTPDEEEEEE